MRAFHLKTPALFARPLRGRARTTHSARWTRRPLALWAALLLATPLPALAGEFVMGLDLDQSGHEDCSATLSDQNGSQEFTGLDRWIEVIVDSTPPARITSLTVWACDGDTFTTSPYSNTSDWPVAVGAGVDGTDAVEWEVPSTVLEGAQSIRLVVGSLQDGVNVDAMLSADPIVITAPTSVPLLSRFASLMLALAVCLVAFLFLRRLPKQSVAFLLVSLLALADHRAGASIGLIIDGLLADWAGIPVSALDPAGDSSDPYGRGDIHALTATLDSGTLFVRLDADAIEDAPCQASPPIAHAADLSACADTPSSDTCSLECSPGWQASQADIACEYGVWDPAATCSPIVLEVSENMSLAEDLAVARLELASGTTLSLADGVALSVGELTLAPGSELGNASAHLSLAVGDTATLSGDARIVASQLTLSGGDWSLDDTASIAGNLDADVRNLNVCPDCVITASGQGHPATAGLGGAASSATLRSASGAGYGGSGGTGYNSSSAGGDAYGEGLAPDHLGSGGGNGCAGAGAGGVGGGALRILVSETLTLAGRLLADGTNGAHCTNQVQYGGGGGSGGSIWIAAGTLEAPSGNRITALGGQGGGSHSVYRGGGGGGGRIMIAANTLGPQPDVALWSVEGGAGRVAGSEGSLWLNEDNDWSAHATQSLDVPTEWTSLTLKPGSELTLEAGSSLTLTDFVMDSNSTLLPADSTSLSTETLVMNADALLEGGLFEITVGSTAALLSTAEISASSLTLSGGHWSLHDTASITANLEAEVTALDVDTNSIISASNRGYSATEGPGGALSVGSFRSASGGGHGGAGSMGYNSTSQGGSPYGDEFAPDTQGSGGGNGCAGAGAGGTGGGRLRLQVTGTLGLAGRILADGANGASCLNDNRYGGGGGAGGSIWITTGVLQASVGNRITALGGQGGGSQTTRRGGGGSGGRVLIEANTVAFEPEAALWSVDGGTGRSGDSGDTGTLWLKEGNEWTAHGANSLDAATDWTSLTLPSGSELTLEIGSSLTVTNLMMESGARILPADDTSLSIDTLVMDPGTAIEAGLFELSVNGTAHLSGDAQITADQLTLTGGDWTLEDTASMTANLEADIGSLSICAQCTLSASALGFFAATGPGTAASVGINRSGSGAGHGGTGGTGHNSTSPGGDPYGDAFAPATPGSGGANGCGGAGAGGAGGGTLRIQTSGTLTLAGSLQANGATGSHCVNNINYGGGGGSGGSIWLNVATLEATAGNQIQAYGGSSGGTQSNYRGGGGSGGRILITTAAVGSEVDPALWSVAGGNGNGQAGTGTLWFNEDQDWIAYGANVLDSATDWHSLTLSDGSDLSLEAGASLTLTELTLETGTRMLPADGVPISADILVMHSGASLEGGDLDLTVTSSATLSGNAQIVASEFNLSGGQWALQDTASITGNLDANVTSLSLCADCVITASALGYSATAGPGGAASSGSSRSGSGAGHGGAGGMGYNSTGGGGSPYGDPLAPDTRGSGGGNGCAGAGPGGTGGGSIRLQVSGTLSLAGRLLSNGNHGLNCANDVRYGGGGGSGGSIWLTAGTLDASLAGNRIEAVGGQAGGSFSSRRGGGGGGGRVQVEAGAVTSAPDTTLWFVIGGTGRTPGSSGSARLEADGTLMILAP